VITLTDSAAVKVKELIDSETEGDEKLFLRIAVRPGGCQGFSYEMFFDSKQGDGDVVSAFGDVSVASDAGSSQLLSGASLDYSDGLEGGFQIENPNDSKTCGCGNG
jgi:iron-sulfur cluster insertion protein